MYRLAARLHAAMAGNEVTEFESVYPRLVRVDADHHIVGRRVSEVRSHGKHLLIEFGAREHASDESDGILLRSHLRMNGRWSLYRRGERWRRGRHRLRILVGTEAFEAVAFDIHDCDIVLPRSSRRPRSTLQARLDRLGPDLLAHGFGDEERLEIQRRLSEYPPNDTIAEVLLDQSVAAGIGNVYRSELLFLAALAPRTPLAKVDTPLGLWLDARRLLLRNVGPAAPRVRTTRWPEPGRVRTPHPDASPLWVYDRAGKVCFRCRERIAVERMGREPRLVYWCPSCQALDRGRLR